MDNYFLNNKYRKHYELLINKALTRGNILISQYVERHHIIPKSLGGSNDRSNLVYLTAKEHFVAHHLLTKICKNKKHANSMWLAFFVMHHGRNELHVFHSRTYSLAKSKMAEIKSANTGSSNHYFGKKHSENTRAKMRSKRQGRICRRDYTTYDFYHKDHGKVSCARYELSEKYGLNKKSLHALVKGNTVSVDGWFMTNGRRYKFQPTGLPKGIGTRKYSENGDIKYRVRVNGVNYGTYTTLQEAVVALNNVGVM